MDVTWAIIRMKLACLMQRGISPGNMKQVASLKVHQSTLNPSVLPFCKIGYCPMIKAPIPILPLCIHSRRMHKLLVIFWKSSRKYHVLCSHLHPSKRNLNEVFRRIFKHRGSFWRNTQRTQLPDLLGKKFHFHVSALGNISVYSLMIFITLSFFNDF